MSDKTIRIIRNITIDFFLISAIISTILLCYGIHEDRIISQASTTSTITKTKTDLDIESALDIVCEHVYPTVGEVTKIRNGIVYISEAGGNVFTFCGNKKYYHKGDTIALLIYDNNTTTETDDSIYMSVNYGRR